jgi:hypothetical protein
VFLTAGYIKLTSQCTTTLLALPRELRDSIYDYVIFNLESDAYNDCGLSIILERNTVLLVCKQVASEFMIALFRGTRVGLQANLDETSIATVADLVRNGVRRQARYLAIDVRSVQNVRPCGALYDTTLRQHLTRALMDVVNTFPRVCDLAIWICVRNVADEKLERMLKHELEELSTITTYRIFTHKNPGWRSRLCSEESLRGESTITWMECISGDEEKQWKPRVIADGQWSTETPVWWIYGSTTRSNWLREP